LGKEERLPKGTVAFTVRIDKGVFKYLVSAVNDRRFKDISEATNTLLKEAIERRKREE